MGILYIVATPIGNLGDITIRAIETLKSVDLVVAEDTRHSKILFHKYDISTQLKSFHAQSSETKCREIITEIQKGKSVAYISDAGTPCISDPGLRLVRLAVEQKMDVVPIPGASALTALVSVAGVPAEGFVFHGFLPHKKGRQTRIQSFTDSSKTNIFYESVHRFPRLLDELAEILGENRKIVVGRELTKLHEEIFRGTVKEAKYYFAKKNTKGEFVVLVSKK
jgi:16S rRNA (cytidine1402-2'-O)-methyltransferase